MRKKMICFALFFITSASMVGLSTPVNAQGKGKGKGAMQGKGIGPTVNVQAQGGIHGQALAELIKQYQLANGIGQVNGKGNGNAKGKGNK